MPKTHLTTARSQRARRNREIIEDLKLKVEMYELLLWGTRFIPTPTSILSRSQRLRIGDVKRVTGASSKEVIRRGVDLFLAQEAPVYLA